MQQAVSPGRCTGADVAASVVVTTRNSAATLRACLESVRAQSHPRTELIVVDNGSSDATLDIAHELADVVVDRGPERSAQRNHGAELATGEVVAFIDSDMVLAPDVLREATELLADPSVEAVVVPEDSFGTGFWTSCRVLERSCYDGDDDVEAARIYRRADVLAAGGFDEDLLGAEDWDLSRRIAPSRLARTRARIRHDEGRIRLRQAYRKRLYYADGYLRYVDKHRGSVSGQTNYLLRAGFRRHWRRLAAHPVRTAGFVVLKAVEVAAIAQVAATRRLGAAAPSGDVYQATGAAVGEHPTAPLLTMVTFGSVLEPLGGLQTRARLTAEVFADELGAPLAIVSHQELRSEAPPWARRLVSPARKPFRGFSWALVRLIRTHVRDADAVMITNAMFIPALLLSGTRKPVIWDTNECQTLHYQRLTRSPGTVVRHGIWWALERLGTWRCTIAIAIGSAEAEVWERHHPGLAGKLAVVDHAVRAVPVEPVAARRALADRLGGEPPGPVLLFLGTLLAKHNRVAADWIADHLAPALPADTTIVLCGPGSDEVVATGGGARLVGLGAVDDVDEVIAAADICLAPLASGAGVKTKVLHYLAHGKPVAGTRVAFEGLEGAPGLHEAELDALAPAVAALCDRLHSDPHGEERARAQRAWLNDHHGRAHVAEQWRSVLQCLTTP